MLRVMELVKWDSMGLGKAENFAEELSENNSFNKVSVYHLTSLFRLKGIPLVPIAGSDYYVYYNYHPTPGFRTVLYITDEGFIAFKVERPRGGVLCACSAEIIVFTVTDRW